MPSSLRVRLNVRRMPMLVVPMPQLSLPQLSLLQLPLALMPMPSMRVVVWAVRMTVSARNVHFTHDVTPRPSAAFDR